MHTSTSDRRNEEIIRIHEISITELHLVTANMEKEIHDYLLQNGVFLDQKTRTFLSNIREVMGATSRRAKRAATASTTSSVSTPNQGIDSDRRNL